MTIAPILKNIPFFSHLSEPELEHLAQHGQIAEYPPGEIVVQEGDTANSMYVILDGQVRVYKCHEDAGEIDIARLDTGSFFGELALLDQGTRSATVSCLTP